VLLSISAGTPTFKIEINTITENTALLIDEVGFYTSGCGGGVQNLDEIRMGTQWYDVVPSVIVSELLLYDDFLVGGYYGYTAGTPLNGKNADHPGFIGPWRDSTSDYWQPYSENLTYAYKTNALISSGGSVQVTIPYDYSKARHVFRTVSNITDSVLYISSLMSFNLDGDNDDEVFAGLLDSDDTTWYAGIKWGVIAGDIGIRCRAENGANNTKFVVSNGEAEDGKVHLFVIKMEKNVNQWRDRVTVYLDPEDLSSEAANTKDLEIIVANLVDSTVLDEIIVSSDSVTNGHFKVDEIRAGTTWEQVVPYKIVPFFDPGTLIMVQ